MAQIIRITIDKIAKFTMPDGTICHGDSDGETFYDPIKDIVYFPYCSKCKNLVRATHTTCENCGASLEAK